MISSVKEFCLMSATGTLLFPNLLTSGDNVYYQKYWEGGILKISSPDPSSACFLQAGNWRHKPSMPHFYISFILFENYKST